MVISKYVLLFEKNGTYLLFNSKNMSFLELTKDLYDELQRIKSNKVSTLFSDRATVSRLVELGVFTTVADDLSFLDELILRHHIMFFSRDILRLTIAPTIACNLRCPYCFETTKPSGIISNEICDKIIEFIKRTQAKPLLDLNWFGGEPLLAIKQIGYFLNQLKENDIELISHSIVTNATLLKDKALELFENYPLTSLQVTFDGIKERHDRIRIHHSGEGSFDEILNNLDVFVLKNPNTHISIRINTGKHNSNDYFILKESLSKRYSDCNNISIYPGILKGDNDCGYKSNFFSSSELSSFYTSLQKRERPPGLPDTICKGCMANAINGYVIGPKGEMYKCWEDIGIKGREIGSVVDNKFRNKALLERYMIHGSFVDDKQCLACGLLPICSGGCSKDRLENKYEGKYNVLCDHYGLEHFESLKESLFDYYQHNSKN